MYKTIETSPFFYEIVDFDPKHEESNGAYDVRPPICLPAASVRRTSANQSDDTTPLRST